MLYWWVVKLAQHDLKLGVAKDDFGSQLSWITCAVDPALFNQAGEDTGALRASRIGKLMSAAAAARAMSAYHIH